MVPQPGNNYCISATTTPAPDNRIGHQGLFFYRLDTGTTFAPNATGLYYNRNRWLSPHLGRFTSRDPNETGMLLVGVLAMNGQALQSLVSSFSPEGHFTDGMNLYVYLNSNPINGADPLGLFSLLDLLGGAGADADQKAQDAAVAAAAKGVASNVANALALRNQILSGIVATASRLDANRALDYLSRASMVLNRTAQRAFTTNTYRAGYDWGDGRLEIWI